MLVARKWPKHAGPAGGRSARECVGREKEGMTADASEGHADPGKRASVAERERNRLGLGDRANC